MVKAVTTATPRTVPRRGDGTHGELHGGLHATMAAFEAAYEAAYGRRPRTETRDAMEAILPWLGRCARHEGRRIMRSVPQMVRGVRGWEPQGSVKADRQKYKHALHRRFRMLQEIGWVESAEAVYGRYGEGEGIAIVLTPAGVAQSVRAAES